jgi:hypothetical protein
MNQRYSRRRRFCRQAALLAGLTVILPTAAMACWVCNAPENASNAAKRYSVVFIGTVEAKNSEVVRFAVKKSFGTALNQVAYMNLSGTSCDFRFEVGKTYLVYTNVDTKPKNYLVAAHDCSRTAEISTATEDLQYWRSRHGSPQKAQP